MPHLIISRGPVEGLLKGAQRGGEDASLHAHCVKGNRLKDTEQRGVTDFAPMSVTAMPAVHFPLFFYRLY
jgi:hypothetical protein